MADQNFSLLLLGRIDIVAPDGLPVSTILAQRKLVALLARLALAGRGGGQFVRRDTLVGLLWPELDQAHARTALRKAVHFLRGALRPDAIVSRGDEEIALDRNIVTCDVLQFVQRIDAGQLAAALESFEGELMPGFLLPGCREFDSWLEQERNDAAERAAAASWALAQRLEGGGNLTEAGAWVRRAVRLSWSDERVLRRAMEMLNRLGDRTGALRMYDNFARRALAELEAAPSPETQLLVRRLRGEQALPAGPQRGR